MFTISLLQIELRRDNNVVVDEKVPVKKHIKLSS